MKSIFSYKKVVFVFCVLIVILLSAGFFIWIKKETDNGKVVIVKSSDISEFEIKDINGKKIIENKTEGFSAVVPDGWIIKKFKYNEDENEISLFSPESEFDDKGEFLFKESYLEKGACAIGMAIKKCEKNDPDIPTDAEMISDYITGTKEASSTSDNFKINWTVIGVGGKDSLRRITKTDNKITSVRAEAPVGQTIYGFSTGIIINQDCVKAFDDFLKTVLINK